MQGLIPSLVVLLEKDHLQGCSLIQDLLVLCPLTIAQARCLDALWKRWGFLLLQR